MTNVQIPISLFFKLYSYVVLGEGQYHDDIAHQLEDKHRGIYDEVLCFIDETSYSRMDGLE